MMRSFLRAIALAIAPAMATSIARGAGSIGAINFTGTTSAIEQSTLGSVSYPPDTDGAVGPGSIVELLNGSFAIYNKSNGSLVSRTTMDAFWNAAMSSAGSSANSVQGSYDPRVLYDPVSGRWLASAAENDSSSTSKFLVAVSNSSDPSAGWKAYTVQADPTGQQWADFPMLGYNGDSVVLSANLFPVGAGNVSSGVIAISKAALLAGPAIDTTTGNLAAAAYQRFNNNYSDTGLSVHPAVDPKGVSGVTSATAFSLLSDYDSPDGALGRSTISGPVPLASFNTVTSGASGAGTITVAPSNPPLSAPQKTAAGAPNLDAGDGRFSGSVIVNNGFLWATQSVDSSGRAAVQWYEIRLSDNAVVQSGLITDPKLALYYPSIAVNDAGGVVIGFTGSGTDQYASSYAVVGTTDGGGQTTFGDLMLLKAGASDYSVVSTDGNRWGDYSATVLDPSNPDVFYTFQEIAAARDTWGVQITEIDTPEPAGVLVLAAFVCMPLLLMRRRSARSNYPLKPQMNADERRLKENLRAISMRWPGCKLRSSRVS